MRIVLGLDPRIEIVGEAEDGEQAIGVVEAVRPEVLLIDVRMPALDGLSAVRRLSMSSPQTALVVLSMSDDEDDLDRALAAGAIGYVLKDRPADEVTSAVHAAAAGEPVLTSAAVGRLLRGPAAEQASEAERGYLAGLARGSSIGEVAGSHDVSRDVVVAALRAALLRLRRPSTSDA